MQDDGSIVVLARRAAALARTEWPARVASRRPVRMRNYRGVQQRKNRYLSMIWNVHTRRLVWLGSYRTPEEAAYAWDAAARVTRGHWAEPNFPEPAWLRAAPAPAPAPEEVSTDLVLALPTPARRRGPAAAVAAQVSFDNSEQQHQHGAPAVVLPHQQQQQGSAELPPFTSAAAPTLHRELPVSQAGVSGLAVVGENFSHGGAASSSAPPPVPRLTLDLLLELPGRGCPGGAQ